MNSENRKVLINSLPKSGTNLVSSAVSSFPGMRYQKLTLNRKLAFHPLNLIPRLGRGETCLCGVDQPKEVRLSLLDLSLRRLEKDHYCMGHLPYDPRVEKLLSDLGIRIFFVIRDPRDIVVSQCAAQTASFLAPRLQEASDDKGDAACLDSRDSAPVWKPQILGNPGEAGPNQRVVEPEFGDGGEVRGSDRPARRRGSGKAQGDHHL